LAFVPESQNGYCNPQEDRIHILETSLRSTLSTESLLHVEKKEHVLLGLTVQITIESISYENRPYRSQTHRELCQYVEKEDQKSLSPRKFPEMNTKAKPKDDKALENYIRNGLVE